MFRRDPRARRRRVRRADVRRGHLMTGDERDARRRRRVVGAGRRLGGEMLGQAAGRDGRRRGQGRAARGLAEPRRRTVRPRPARRRPQPDLLVLQHQQAQRGHRLPHDRGPRRARPPARRRRRLSSRPWRRRELHALGIDLDALRAAAPALVVVSITPFGLDGPWADRLSSDLVGLALGGPLNSCGYDDHSIPPIRPGGDQGYQSAASFALMGLMLALHRAPGDRPWPAGGRRHARLLAR